MHLCVLNLCHSIVAWKYMKLDISCHTAYLFVPDIGFYMYLGKNPFIFQSSSSPSPLMKQVMCIYRIHISVSDLLFHTLKSLILYVDFSCNLGINKHLRWLIVPQSSHTKSFSPVVSTVLVDQTTLFIMIELCSSLLHGFGIIIHAGRSPRYKFMEMF